MSFKCVNCRKLSEYQEGWRSRFWKLLKRDLVYQMLFWCDADVARLDQNSEVDEVGRSRIRSRRQASMCAGSDDSLSSNEMIMMTFYCHTFCRQTTVQMPILNCSGWCWRWDIWIASIVESLAAGDDKLTTLSRWTWTMIYSQMTTTTVTATSKLYFYNMSELITLRGRR